MSTSVWGVVKESRGAPKEPLPDGAPVEIRLPVLPTEISEELRSEIEAWDRAGANALELVEWLAQEGAADAAR